tara:strand:+ start:76321 stop:76461 length:141 start_codon:yes stop_codon:yes gene_type:complete
MKKKGRTSEGLVVNYRTTKPGEHTYAFKIILMGKAFRKIREFKCQL